MKRNIIITMLLFFVFAFFTDTFPLKKARVDWDTKDADSSEAFKREQARKKKLEEIRRARLEKGRIKPLAADDWYLKLSLNVSYTNLGPELQNELKQIEDIFSGKEINLHIINYSPTFTMNSDKKIARTKTEFLPTGNIGLGYVMGKHQFEIDVGMAGMVTLNTIDVSTGMTMTETVAADLNDSPMAKLGFVDPVTGVGEYDLKVVMNEEIWMLAPSIYYDYTFYRKRWGSFSGGCSLGLMFISIQQRIEFRAERVDIDADMYGQRVLEASVTSTAINDYGPMTRLYVGFKRKLVKKIKFEVRLGVQYGYVDIQRDVDGSGTVIMGDTLPASFPITSMKVGGKNFDSRETNRLEFLGFFSQAGIIF